MNMKMKKWNSLFSVFLFCSVAIGACMFAACRSKPVGSSYTVTFGVEGSGGTVTAKIGSSTIDNSTISGLSAGTKIVFTAKPDAGYTVEQWIVNNDKKNGDSYTLTVNADTKVTVRFVKTQQQDPSTPPTVTHKVTIKAGEHGKITANPALPEGGLVAAGTEIAFTATPDSQNYKINEWTIKGSSFIGENSAGTQTVKAKITAETEVSVTFVAKDAPLTTYTITFPADANHGKLTAAADGKSITSGESVLSGKKVTFTAEPESGYMLTSWTVNGKTESSRELTRTISITENTTVTAVFEKYYTVTLAPVEHGQLTVSPELKDGKVAENTLLTFTAEPETDKGYIVDTWSLSSASSSFEAETGKPGQAEAKLKVTADVTVEVSFKLNTFQVTYSADSSSAGLTLSANYEGGTPVPASPATVEYGKKITFTATESPKPADKVIEWKIEGCSADEGGKRGDTSATITITKNTTVTVAHIDISVQDILNKLEAPPAEAESDFALPTLADQTVTWESSNPQALKIENDKAVVTQDIVAQKVTLTATLTRNGETAKRTFEVTVKPVTKITMDLGFNRTQTYTFENGTLEILKEENNSIKEGSRYAVTINHEKKTLKPRLIAKYHLGSWLLSEALIEQEISDIKKTITVMMWLGKQDTLTVPIVKAAFGNTELSDEDFFNRNKSNLFGGDKTYNDFKNLPEQEQTQKIKASIEQGRKQSCSDIGLPDTASWEEMLQKLVKNNEHFYNVQPHLYSYALTKAADGKYSITIQSVYDADKAWYEQKGGRYENTQDKNSLTAYERGPLFDIFFSSEEYTGILTENGHQFTAKARNSTNNISGTIDDSKQDGTLIVTISGAQYEVSLVPVPLH